MPASNQRLPFMVCLLVLAAAPVPGCGTSGGGGGGGGDGGQDGGTPGPLCAELTAPDTTLTLDPTGRTTQIHVAATFAAEQIFVAYSIPVETKNFAIQGLRVRCDGTVPSPPFVVSEDVSINQLDPAIAGSGERILIAWQADTGAAPYNLDTFTRVYDTAGGALGPPTVLAAKRLGVLNPQNAWMPQAVGWPAGGFFLAGAWGHDASTRFQTYGLRLDPDGLPEGDAFDWALEPDTTQIEPDLALDGDGVLHAVWAADSAAGAFVSEVILPAGASSPDAATLVAGSEGGGSPHLASFERSTWLAFQSATGPTLRRPDGTLLSVGQAGDHGLVVAASAAGAQLAWYRTISGIRNGLRTAFVPVGGVLEGEQDLGTATAAPYPLSLTALPGGRFFVAWQEGENTAFVLRARFLTP